MVGDSVHKIWKLFLFQWKKKSLAKLISHIN